MVDLYLDLYNRYTGRMATMLLGTEVNIWLLNAIGAVFLAVGLVLLYRLTLRWKQTVYDFVQHLPFVQKTGEHRPKDRVVDAPAQDRQDRKDAG